MFNNYQDSILNGYSDYRRKQLVYIINFFSYIHIITIWYGKREGICWRKKNLETHLALVRAFRVPCLIQGSDQAPPPSRLPGPRPPGSPPPRRTSFSRCVPSGRTSSLRYITHIQGEGGGRSIIKIPACENILKSLFWTSVMNLASLKVEVLEILEPEVRAEEVEEAVEDDDEELWPCEDDHMNIWQYWSKLLLVKSRVSMVFVEFIRTVTVNFLTNSIRR